MTPFERKRMAAGLSQAQLAKRVGVTHRSVTEWEKGRTTPRPQHFPKLAKVFRITPEEVTHLFAPDPAPVAGGA